MTDALDIGLGIFIGFILISMTVSSYDAKRTENLSSKTLMMPSSIVTTTTLSRMQKEVQKEMYEKVNHFSNLFYSLVLCSLIMCCLIVDYHLLYVKRWP